MISVLTLTYGRQKLLEECIYSFLKQNYTKGEMVIINDDIKVKYRFDYPNIKIINLDYRFDNLSKKLKYGFNECKFNYIYRLDDDDLLSPNALKRVENQIKNNPNYNIYRSSSHYSFVNNRYMGVNGSVNNGNVYSKEYINNIDFPDKSFGEDTYITFNSKSKIHESKQDPTMIYRWGMSTYHVSGMGDISQDNINKWVDSLTDKKEGTIDLYPKFNDNYYEQINKNN
jgi:glycosyltransferase involved in cell wall biosynthesis